MPRRPLDPVAESSPPSSPTRRHLLTLMVALPAATPFSTITAGCSPFEDLDPDPVRRLFAEFQDRVAEHELAFQRCSRLEARLAAEVGHPRVRLPRVAGQPIRYAAETHTIDETVPPGLRRDRLHRVLWQRRERWDEAGRAAELNEAQAHEEAQFDAVRDAAIALHTVPATTLTSILLKFIALLSLEAPGQAIRDASPWRELHLILADLARLAAAAGTDR